MYEKWLKLSPGTSPSGRDFRMEFAIYKSVYVLA